MQARLAGFRPASAEEMSSVSNESDDTHALPRTLAGATILQIVAALREEPTARGDRVIAPSNFAAAPVVARYGLTPDRITVIPREIDMAAFDPASVDRERVEALRQNWKIADDLRVLLVPGRVAPWNGQLMLPDI